MNTRLLRMAWRDRDGGRHWTVPGYGNGIKTVPPHGSGGMAWGWSVRWPGHNAKGEFTRAVDLDRHWKLARQEIRALLDSLPKNSCQKDIQTA